MRSFNQNYLLPKIRDFFTEISRGANTPNDIENFPEEDMQGLCVGFSLLMLDADTTDKQDAYVASLFKFNEVDQAQIVKMAKIFNQYQKRYKDFIQANKALLQTSLSDYERNRSEAISQIQKLKVELAAATAEEKLKIEEKISAAQKLRTEADQLISQQRQIHFARIEAEFLAMIKSEMPEEQILLYQTAKAFYEFCHALIAIGGGSNVHFVDEANLKISDDDVIERLRIIGATSANLLEMQFSIFMNLSDDEFENIISTVMFDKDKVSLTFQLGHNMYLTKNHGIYTLFDSNADELIEACSAKELVTKLRETFFETFKIPPGEYISYGIQIFRNKNEPIAEKRPTMKEKLKEILERRKNEIVDYDKTNIEDVDGNTALHSAAFLRNPEEAQILLEYKANPNARNDMGNTPMHNAVREDRVELVKLLLTNRADLEIRNDAEQTPLMTAIRFDSMSTARLLLESKVNPNMTGDGGRTALLNAAQLGNLPAIKLLLEHKAHYDIKDRLEQSFLFCAVQSKNEALVRYLLNELKLSQDVNSSRFDKATPLSIALENSTWRIAELLLEHGAIPFLPNVQDEKVIRNAHQAGEFHICVRMEYKEKISQTQNQWLKTQIDKLLELKDESLNKHCQKIRDETIAIFKAHSDPEIQFYLLKQCLLDHLNAWSDQLQINSDSQLGSLGMLSQAKESEMSRQFFNSIYSLLKEINNITRISYGIEREDMLEKMYAQNKIEGFPDPIPQSSPIIAQKL